MGVDCHQSWCFVGRHFQLYNTSTMIPNWPWAWPCWNWFTSYKFSVSVKKMGEGWTGGASDMVNAESSGEDPKATGGFVSNLPYLWVNKRKQYSNAEWLNSGKIVRKNRADKSHETNYFFSMKLLVLLHWVNSAGRNFENSEEKFERIIRFPGKFDPVNGMTSLICFDFRH